MDSTVTTILKMHFISIKFKYQRTLKMNFYIQLQTHLTLCLTKYMKLEHQNSLIVNFNLSFMKKTRIYVVF
jgi:hypothetical protein